MKHKKLCVTSESRDEVAIEIKQLSNTPSQHSVFTQDILEKFKIVNVQNGHLNNKPCTQVGMIFVLASVLM